MDRFWIDGEFQTALDVGIRGSNRCHGSVADFCNATRASPQGHSATEDRALISSLHTVTSNFKRFLIGTLHGVSKMYNQEYVNNSLLLVQPPALGKP